ncbi:DUF551 domain-containing protein [Citrobacter amalonaticus]|uniref:DUF551 domain-containing protein n=1 Tax=Citrobacter amalonaticus TaxID=35703 RepID=UPI001787E6A4|nr:DUF551 domain-containing protein [Citrobacter amalonaticus]MBE0395328.1 DUF551 domain-containing protein [Citrobacter amalonaticus]
MEWIKCTERVPEKYTDILIYTTKPGEILLAYLTSSNEFFYDRDTDGDELTCYATHWMPLPEPPSE